MIFLLSNEKWYSFCLLVYCLQRHEKYEEVEVQLHHSWPRHYMKMNGRPHVSADLPSEK